MKYRKIGNSDLEVSVISLGSWVFGGDCWGRVEDAVSVRVVEEAVENGINFFDTAPIYGGGRSEEIIGKALKHKTDNVIIAAKMGLEQKGSSIRPNLSAAFIREEVENSLRRLQVETIDLYQCHWPDPNTSMEETFGELKKLIKEGKVRYIGVSNFEKGFLEQAAHIAPVESNQIQYSLLERDKTEEIMPLCNEKGISILAYGALGGGILTGKYKEPPVLSKGDVRSFFYKFYKEPEWTRTKDLVSTLEEIAGKHKVPVSQAAINWVLSHKEVASCIVGCRTPEQLNQNIGLADWEISPEELATIQTKHAEIFS